jgi:hypothetical protein
MLPDLALFDARLRSITGTGCAKPTPADMPAATSTEYHGKEGDAAAMNQSREKIERALDEALEESFPASDPVSIVTSQDEEYWDGERLKPGPQAPAAPAKGPSAPA